MKNLLFLLLLLIFSCNEKKELIVQNKMPQRNIVHKVLDWQEGFELTHNIDKDSIWNKPVRFYLENKQCNQTAKDFYFGKYRPTDDPKTAELLSLVTTDNNDLRPFYRWILNKTIIIQDGALAEYTGVPARKYAEKFPKESFEYMDYDKSGEKYLDWKNAIVYSGFYDLDDYKNSKKIRDNLIKTMNSNCKDCEKKMIGRIEKFAKDCFQDQ